MILKPNPHNLSQTAIRILEARYLQRNNQGKIIESPTQMFRRVSKAIAAVEKTTKNKKKYEAEFYKLLSELKFLPNSPTLMNAGKKNGQLSACFVLPVEDHLEDIFNTIKNSALIHKTGGGTGFDFSKLRSEGASVSTAIGVAAGPVAFIKLFDQTTEIIKQGGVRRGANMGILSARHPDVLKFISEKQNRTLSNFNISVSADQSFMDAVLKNKTWNLVDPFSKKIKQKVKAKTIWNKIVEAAWTTGDPGLVFIDEINKHNPTPKLAKMFATNPCGEQPLLPYESCNLGSIDVSKYINNGKISWSKLRDDIHTAIRFLDNVIDANSYPLVEIDKITKANRKIGLGIMGWADALIKLNIPYSDSMAIDFAEQFMKLFQAECILASEMLAKERGAFPNFKFSKYKNKRRNATVTTIAPTGTISLIAGCSSGIEPVFALAYERTSLEGRKFQFINNELISTLKNIKHKNSELNKLINTGSAKHFKNLSNQKKKLFQTAYEINWKQHLYMQAAFQKHCENAVSKTINLPSSATKSDISKIYLLAHKLKCKGVTIYRDKSKSSQVLRAGVSVASKK